MTLDPVLDITVRELLYRLQQKLQIDEDHIEGEDGAASYRRGSFFVCSGEDYLLVPMRTSARIRAASIKVRFEVTFHDAIEGTVELFRISGRGRRFDSFGTVVVGEGKLRLTSKTGPGKQTTKSLDFLPEREVPYSVRYLLDMRRKFCRVTMGTADEASRELLQKKLDIPDSVPARTVHVVFGRLRQGKWRSPAGAEFSDLEFIVGT